MGAGGSCLQHKPNKAFVKNAVTGIARHLAENDERKSFRYALCRRDINEVKSFLEQHLRGFNLKRFDLDMLEHTQLLVLCLRAYNKQITNCKGAFDLRRGVEDDVSLEKRLNTHFKEKLQNEIADLINRFERLQE